MNDIKAKNLKLGSNIIIESTATFKGLSSPIPENIEIGDNTYIGHDVQIICDNFKIGDYSKIHHHTNIHGLKPCVIGHNVWIGQYSIIDTQGGVIIGNNCGIGAHSQLWSHIKYGDTLEGCRFMSNSPLYIGNDVWLVGHCIMSPVRVEDKAMALVGSVITKDMQSNHIYAGSPIKDVTERFGFQFKEISIDEKYMKMLSYLRMFDKNTLEIKVVKNIEEIDFDRRDITFFDVSTRKYTKNLSNQEQSFMRFLLPDKAKFVPF